MRFGNKIARSTLRPRDKARDKQARGGRRQAAIFALTGELGSGKTTFTQGFFGGLGVKKRVSSPTFVLIRSYSLRLTTYNLAYHIDCYRLRKPKELLDLGFQEILVDPRNIVVIEWAGKVRRYLPKSAVWVKFEHGKRENERSIVFH